MAAALLRRSVATAGLAVISTLAAPMAAAAWADVTPLAAPTFAPANGDTVAATRPAISATYNTALDHALTQLVLIDKNDNNRQVSCPQVFSEDSTSVGCTPAEDLVDKHGYSVHVHAVNAADPTHDTRNDTADWTVDIPFLTVASPGDGSTVAVAQTLTATYDETIDSHSTAKLVNGFGVTVPGSVSVAKSGATGACPTSNCILKFVASQSLPAGNYTVTYDAFGVTSSVGGSENAAAYAHNVVHFIVDKTVPSVAPTGGPDVDVITQANQKAVPFSGYALPGFNVGVAIYDNYCDQHCDFPSADKPGTGPQDGSNHVLVDNCTDDQAHTVNSGGHDYRVCPFALTVDASHALDSGDSEAGCCPPPYGASTAVNQWYVYSYSSAGQKPAAASPGSDQAIQKDTSAPAEPDPSAHGYLTNNSPSAGNASIHVAASDFSETPDAYVVKATDGYGHSKTWSQAPNGAGNLLGDFTLAPADGLFDGPVTVGVAAADQYGNVSAFRSVTLDNGKSFDKEVLQLATVNPASHTDSMTTATGTRDFADLTSAAAKAGVPTAVTVHFNEPIALTVPDNTLLGDGTPSAHLCIIAPGSICTTPNGTGTLTNPSDDPTALTWTAPDGFGADLPSGAYEIAAFAPAANCPARDDTNSGSYNCETSSGDEGDFTSWPVLAAFTIDRTAPAIQTLTVTPTTITPSKVRAVQVTGTSDPDTTTVQVSIKSSGGGATRVLSQDVTPPSDPNATSVSWKFFPIDLSGMRDGTLTISAFATDDAGNKTAAPGTQITATLAAHKSTLTEKASSSRITYGQILQVSGRLVDQAGTGIKNATILVKPRFDNGRYGTATKAVTDSTGHWGAIVAPAQNATWYASYAGSTTSPLHDAASVHTARTLVRAAIRFTSPKNHATVGSPVTLKGLVGPNKRGVTIRIYRHTSTGNKLVGRATLNRYSRWSFKLTLPKGTVKLFAVIDRTSGNLGNRSTYLTITH